MCRAVLWKQRQLMGQNAAVGTYASCGKQHEAHAWSFEIVIGKGRHWISDLHPDLPQLVLYHGKMLASKNEECLKKKKSTKSTIVSKSLVEISSAHTYLIFFLSFFFLYSFYFPFPFQLSQMIVLANKMWLKLTYVISNWSNENLHRHSNILFQNLPWHVTQPTLEF